MYNSFDANFLFFLILFAACTTANNLSLETNQPPCDMLASIAQSDGTIRAFSAERNTTIKIQRAQIDTLSSTKMTIVTKYLQSYIPDFGSGTQFIFMHYYLGKDSCNSTGSATRDGLGEKHLLFTNEIETYSEVAQLNVYQDRDGLERWSKNRTWKKDNEETLAKQFFSASAPCFSHLIMHTSGVFYQHNGPSSTEAELEELRAFVSCIKGGGVK